MAVAHRPEPPSPDLRDQPRVPSLAQALERTYAAGEQLASDRLALVLFEVRVWAGRAGGAAVVGLVAGIAGVLGWIGLAAALGLWRWGGLPLEGRLALIAAAHLLLALLLAVWAQRRLGAPRGVAARSAVDAQDEPDDTP